MWTGINNSLVKEFEFTDFKSSVDFINRVKDVAEEKKHHPDILIHSYKYVRITLTTHDKKRVTEKDHELARLIDKIITS